MESKGIRIYVKQDDAIHVKLLDILDGIDNGNKYYWSILEIEASGYLGEGKNYMQLEEEVQTSPNGFFINWEELKDLSRKLDQVIWITIIGCTNKDLLKRYDNDQEMYTVCDFVIEVFDGGCFEIFSKEKTFIEFLIRGFNKTEIMKIES